MAREKKGGFVAIGECGLDLSQNNKLSLTVQKKAFSEQVSLALRLELPLVLHIREAEREGREGGTSTASGTGGAAFLANAQTLLQRLLYHFPS